MAFKARPAPEISADTPELLFPLLLRTGKNSPSMWSHQTDILRDYATRHRNTRDLAIELPTGTGKTLPGLLIADWRRRSTGGRSIFACPTVQLVRQVMAAANREGVPVVDLSGSYKLWDAGEQVRYESGRATAVVPYSSIFNLSPKLANADVIVFDDAHAGEQYVSSAYSVAISRAKHAAVYEDVIEAIKPGLTTERHSQLIMTTPGSGTRSLIDAVFPAVRDEWLDPLDRALSRFESLGQTDKEAKSQSYRYAAIRQRLSACVVYVTWDRIEIRPLIPPTFDNALFASAQQRLYLSATLGSAGELERAFGRPKIGSLSLPPGAAQPKSGRRFIVFPHLVPGADGIELTKELLALTNKAIVIAPSDWAATQAEKSIVPDGWKIFDKNDVEDSFDSFVAADNAAVVLANRYDGIDLPGDACRAVALFGFPGATNLQEQFLSTRARSSSVIDERVRSRVVQGTGRCTRGPGDWALVIVADAETTTYLSRREVQLSLDEDLQAEVVFGLEQSETSRDGLIENVKAFLDQGEPWRRDAEPTLGEIRSEVKREVPPAAAGLKDAAVFEVEALECAWNGDWQGAGEKSHSAAEALGPFPPARGYRATQLFVAAVHTDKASRLVNSVPLEKAADGLAAQAVAAANPATWMKTLLPFPGRVPQALSATDAYAIDKLTELVKVTTNTNKLNADLGDILAGLSAVDHKEYEPALSSLGLLLGAESWKPKGDGRADSVWCWGNHLWLTLEAKSEHISPGPIGLDDVRQVNEHLAFLADDLKVSIPDGSASVMISPRAVFKRDAITIADPSTYKLDVSDMLSLARATERLWLRLVTLRNITGDAERRAAVEETLRDVHLLPTDILDRLTMVPIGSL